MLPTLIRAAILVNPANLSHLMALAAAQRAARALGLELVTIEVKARDDIAAAIIPPWRHGQLRRS